MLVTDPRQRASLQEIIHHPWILKGFSGPPENHLPPREPLTSPLDPEVTHGMTGFEFGSSETITAHLTKVIESEDYRIAVQAAAKEAPMVSPNLEKRKPFGFDFYKRRSSTSSKDTLTNLSTELLSHPSNPDPINAYNPLISVYYLVREKLERDRASSKSPGSQPSQPIHDIEKLRIPIPKAPEAAHTSETSYEVRGEPVTPSGRTRPRARTHGDEEVSEAMKKVNLGGMSIPPSPVVPPSAIREDNPAKKESTVGGMLRRFSTRRQHSGRGDSKAPPPPTLSVQAPGQAPVEIATPRKSLSVRRPPAERPPVTSSGLSQSGAPDLLTPPTTADGPGSKRSAKIGRSTSVSEADWRRKYGRQNTTGDPPGTSGSDHSGLSIREDAIHSDKGTSSTAKPMAMRAKSLGHGRRENNVRRARREETPAASVPNDVPEEDVGDGATSTGSGDGETPSSDFVKPVYLKGLFSVATTSTKPPTEIRTDIIRVLKQLGVSYKEIRGGFSCVHRPSIDLKSVQENVPQTPEATNMVQPPSHKRKLSFGGSGSSTKEAPPPPPLMKGQSKRNRADTSYTNSDVSNESMHDGVLGGSLILQFEIYIVKVPLLSLHGIQFKSVSKTNTWQYKGLASRILQELRL